MSQFNKQALQQQIAAGETAEVLQFLTQNVNNIQKESLRKEVLHLSARWHDYERAVRMSMTPQNELDISKRQIDHSLLNLLDQLAISSFQEGKTIKWRNFFVIAGGIIAALAGIAEITGKNISNLWQADEAQAVVDTIVLPTSTEPAKDTLPIEKIEVQKEPTPTPPPARKEKVITPSTPVEDKTEAVVSPKAVPLKVTCSTNKGKNNLRFQEGEIAEFYYQVNQPCYIRIIGKQANGRIVLIYDDEHIEQADIDKQLLLGRFEVAEPLGKEELYFFAQKKKFPTLTTTYSDDGYDVITAGLPQALNKTRGFKVVNEYAEARLEVETYQ